MSQVQPKQYASRICNEQHALEVAAQLAQQFREGAAARDRERELPHSPLQTLFQSGLGAITVPQAYGGIAVSTATLVSVITLISEADAAIGQVPQNHYYALEVLRVNGSESQKQRLYREVLTGVHLGNALAEFSSRAAHQRTTQIRCNIINGNKFYATGALFADRIPTAARDEEDKEQLVFVPRHLAGVTVIDDWSGFGQRTTGSGSVLFENVTVDAADVVPFQTAFERPTTVGPFAQIMHAAIDQGIARAAFNDMLDFLRQRARPWPDSGVTRATDDPLTLDRTGRLAARLSAGDALLAEAGAVIDAAQQQSDAATVALASVEVARARAWTTEVSLEAANLLFELGGSRSSLREYNFDRHWRNARTHTLHDPVRWKYPAIGNYLLNGVLPPRRGTL
ncbi:SfnB family sulfur acquisition oxidoreductase [Pantoea sp. Bo_2]|uniref:SfnB family sulfur acquisition oxidoreductase n=1 Tax=unclassified Pantoea TaxID=2630326 RepID=UPI0012325FD2|nr:MULTISPECIES: SfnB family sulfur acquisition oxidoreductase [unclassified Pantoea]KAA5940160.1 SfnB family sulfur acquisition oxidoreductase [Pantoea sp. VH_3]KAA5948884.1 SfnB family sulfur acquisition oxidoreductase [Pantoea sp. VH_25]KAA5952975.1 SfnB family sulfur acquisition oxidoreductase [Pantoea sp. VH_24]KAA5956730.1 SfnB family sulfur acquisition oxidoreductase [Pantoea sp. VH_16]KAA5962778.1 SfnB family sulfur acquisition oxidoreductase [Pantoea sp. VH_18]